MLKKVKKGMIIKQTHRCYTVYLEVLKEKPDRNYKNYPSINVDKYYLVKCLVDDVKAKYKENYGNYEGEILNWYIKTGNNSENEDEYKEITFKEMILERL